MRKKVLALVLALVMVVAMLPTVAFAATPVDDIDTLAQQLGTEKVTVDKNANKITLKEDVSNIGDLAINVEGLILDLDQYSIELQSGCTLIFNASATITGKDNGEIKQASGGYWSVQVGSKDHNNVKVSLTGGKITAGDNSTASVLIGGTDFSGCSFSVSGGTIESKSTCIAVVVRNGSTFDMTDGTISAEQSCVQVQGENSTATVAGGKITNTDEEGAPAVVATEKAIFNMTGGEISTPGQAVRVSTTTQDESGDKSKGTKATIGGTAKITRTAGENKNFGLLEVEDYCELNIEGSAVIDDEIMVFKNGTLNVKGGTITSEGYAIGTNGSESTGAKINITGGTITGGNESCGVYLPAGTMTVSGDAKISGGAGIVVRGGTLDVKGGSIEATGSGNITVGDAKKDGAEYSVPAAGITVDKNNGYNNGQNTVTVSGGTVTATADQPTVAYSEEGNAKDVKPDGQNNKIEVTGGTFESGTKADYTVTNYVDSTHGVNPDGTVKTANEVQLAIVDFGYLADAIDGIGPNKTVWTSPKGIDYTVWNSDNNKWGDATFYWAFNRALTQDEVQNGGVEVTFTCGEQTFTDTCEAEGGIRFASSLMNSTQLGDDVANNGGVITAGDYTISSADSKFTVSSDIKPAEVTLPKSVTDKAPEIIKAPTANKEGTVEDTEDYTVEYTAVDTENDVYSVKIDATKVTEHQNEKGVYGYWTGMAVKLGEGQKGTINGYYVKIGKGDWQYSGLDKINGEGDYACIYFKDLGDYEVQLVWTEDTEATKDADTLNQDASKLTFNVTVDITYGTSEKPTPVIPSGGGTATPAATVTTPASTNGSYTVSDKNAKAGDTVTITPKADEGYTVDAVVVTDKDGKDVTVTDNGDGTYSFVMPEKASQPVTVKVTFAKVAPSAKFVDVPQTAWYAEYVDYVVANGLMEGTSDTIFSPNMTTNRAMLVTILYRLEGKPAVTKDIPFSDVAAGEWYSDAINWAAANEIVNGYGDNTFRPLRELSREEAAAILYRYAEYKEYDVTATDDLAGYTDAETVSTWADTAMSWAVAEGIIKGTSETKLTPDGTAIRAQAAAMLTRFCENVAK